MSRVVGTILMVVVGLIAWYADRDSHSELSPVTDPDDLMRQYDYIVVGGGAVGCVVAARLSEDPVTVLVLEVGEEESYEENMELPAFSPDNLLTSRAVLEPTVPQEKACQGMEGKRCVNGRATVLGGGGSINGAQYSRGHAEDYDKWAELGAEGWSYRDVLPYFIKSENIGVPELRHSEYHGTEGPMHIAAPPGGFTPVASAWVQAGKELGWNEVDYLGETQEGFHTGYVTIYPDGTRVSTVKAYLRPAMRRQNLHVSVESFVTKIIFEDSRAVGVEFDKHGVSRKLTARREVILSAGTIGSAKLLMLSGVGHKSHLQEMGLPVVADLPVGDNLQEHMALDAVAALLPRGVAITAEDLGSYYESFKHRLTGRSKLSAGFTGDGVCFTRLPSQPEERRAPFMEMLVLAKLFGDPPEATGALSQIFGWTNQTVSEQIPETMSGRDGYHILIALLHPYSRGTVRLSSPDPHSPPTIDPRHFSDSRDVTAMLDGIRIAQKIAQSDAMTKLGSEVLKRPLSACTASHAFDSDAYWTCVVRHYSMNMYHTSGTCRMGAEGDRAAVVDPQLRVRGLSGLRVADLSVAPEVPGGTTYGPAVMIGEKAADLIRNKVTV